MKDPRIRTALFDAGNTLFCEEPLRWEIYARVGREAGLSIETEAMRRAMIESHDRIPQRIDGHFRYSDRWFQEYIPAVFARFGARPEQIPSISEKLFAQFRQPQTFRLFPDTIETLDALRGMGLTMGIVSNWSPRLPGICERLGLAPFFDFILSSAIEEMEKPDPGYFRRALSRAQASAESTLHVGDSLEKDVQGAKSVGILGVLLDRAGRHSPPAGSPRIRSLRELIPMIEGK